MQVNVNSQEQKVVVDLDKTGIISTPVCPLIREVENKEVKRPLTHQPDHDKADMCEGVARGYELMWKATGRKHYKDAMDAAFADAKDYRSCGFVRPLGATV